ncbi:craniofacial development protein 2-like [Cydia fagiglandana]|uniref:craniofacial development protein 2-like n=1 Tax=Cydia fagiglandana TaxID=1458189 RepID=UPI002FEDE937
MTGRSSELSEVLKRRRIDACCIQETKWKGSKSRLIGNGYKLIYYGTTSGKNGVGIILSEKLTQRLVGVERVTDRLMAVKIALENQPVMNIICAYTPQTNSKADDKDAFWDDLYLLINNIPKEENIDLGADLNGHVGRVSTNAKGCHGGHGYGVRNLDGDRIIQFATICNLAIVNTYFKKKDAHLITYSSGGHSTQVDYVLARKRQLESYRDSKVIPGEALTTQHRILVTKYKLPKPIRINNKLTPKIKWRSLKDEAGQRFIHAMVEHLKPMDNNRTTDEEWNDFETTCRSTAEKHLGRTRNRKGPFKETEWWQTEVKKAIDAKKKAFIKWQSTGDDSDRNEYKEAKHEAKRQVAKSRAKSNSKFYDNLESAKSDIDIFRIAKSRNNNSKDISNVKYIKGKDNKLLTNDSDINDRWVEYYENL